MVLNDSFKESSLDVYVDKQIVYKDTQSSSVRIPRKGVYIQMEDIKKLSVYESNELIYAAPKTDTEIIKIFELAAASLNTTKENDRKVFIEKDALFEHLAIADNKNKLAKLKEYVERALKELLFDLSTSIEDVHMTNALELAKWEKNSKFVEIKFSESIMPYLKNIDGSFTRYSLMDISKLTNKYSIFLYKIFIMYFNQFKKYDNKKLRNPSFSLKELRGLLDIKEDEYTRIDNFYKRVINDPLEDINKHSVIKVSAEPEKSGRLVVGYKFYIEENPENMPKPEQKLKPRLSKEERDAKRREAAGAALESEYTKLLRAEHFLSPSDLMDTYLMARLYEDLYPLYDEIVEIRGLDSVKDHIKQTHNKRLRVGSLNDINDVVGYLVTSFKNAKRDHKFQ